MPKAYQGGCGPEDMLQTYQPSCECRGKTGINGNDCVTAWSPYSGNSGNLCSRFHPEENLDNNGNPVFESGSATTNEKIWAVLDLGSPRHVVQVELLLFQRQLDGGMFWVDACTGPSNATCVGSGDVARMRTTHDMVWDRTCSHLRSQTSDRHVFCSKWQERRKT